MKTASQLQKEIALLQGELASLLKVAALEKEAALAAKFPKKDTVVSYESDGIEEREITYAVHHNGIEFDFETALSERDHDGRRELLFELEEQGLCAVVF